MAAFLLVHFALVAASAIFRRDNDGDRRAVMLEGIAVGFFCFVAVVAADAFLPVGAGEPFLGEARIERTVTLETGIVLFRKLTALFVCPAGLRPDRCNKSLTNRLLVLTR